MEAAMDEEQWLFLSAITKGRWTACKAFAKLLQIFTAGYNVRAVVSPHCRNSPADSRYDSLLRNPHGVLKNCHVSRMTN